MHRSVWWEDALTSAITGTMRIEESEEQGAAGANELHES